MPRVTIRTGFFTPDGRAEELSEFLCDAPGCPNVATQVVGVIREIGLRGGRVRATRGVTRHVETCPTNRGENPHSNGHHGRNLSAR